VDRLEKRLTATIACSVIDSENGHVATRPAPASNPPDPPADESEPTGTFRSRRAATATGASSIRICVRAVRSPGASVDERTSNAVPRSSA
jgi:hypothetical protein